LFFSQFHIFNFGTVATSQMALRSMCDPPLTRCAQKNTSGANKQW